MFDSTLVDAQSTMGNILVCYMLLIIYRNHIFNLTSMAKEVLFTNRQSNVEVTFVPEIDRNEMKLEIVTSAVQLSRLLNDTLVSCISRSLGRSAGHTSRYYLSQGIYKGSFPGRPLRLCLTRLTFTVSLPKRGESSGNILIKK